MLFDTLLDDVAANNYPITKDQKIPVLMAPQYVIDDPVHDLNDRDRSALTFQTLLMFIDLNTDCRDVLAPVAQGGFITEKMLIHDPKRTIISLLAQHVIWLPRVVDFTVTSSDFVKSMHDLGPAQTACWIGQKMIPTHQRSAAVLTQMLDEALADHDIERVAMLDTTRRTVMQLQTYVQESINSDPVPVHNVINRSGVTVRHG